MSVKTTELFSAQILYKIFNEWDAGWKKIQMWKVSWNHCYCTFPQATIQQISVEFPSKLQIPAMTWIHLYQTAPSDGTMQVNP